jgi:3-dehydroquinate synthase
MAHPERIDIRTAAGPVPLCLGCGLDPADLEAELIRPLAPDGVGIISDTTVFQLYGRPLESLLESRGHRVITVVLPPGETSKTLEIAIEIYGELCENRFSRRSVLLALGGGVVGDLTGFVAGTYMRGIRFLQLPTSLLAQVDSSIGGKVGVNHSCSKNLVGLFHQPAAIWADTRCLDTLPPAEYLNAFGEILKYALVLDEPLFNRLEALPSVEAVRADAALQAELVRRCIRAKVSVVEQDEHEAGLRRVLNFGHTFGHALEVAGRYLRFRHGEAVAMGMLLAQELGAAVGAVDGAWADRSAGLIRRLLPLPATAGLATDEVLRHLGRDKKNVAGRRFFVFSTGPGRFVFREDVPESAIRPVLERFLATGGAAPA